MANIRKTFNFRDGVQVDDKDLVVRGTLVGIGTTVPTERLDVRGNARVVGLMTATDAFVSGIATINNTLRVGSTVRVVGSSGSIPATSFYGNGATLSNLPTSQWVDVDVGLGFTSIYAAGFVGIATLDPRNTFQIGGNPFVGQLGVGFNTVGDMRASGIVSAASFVGSGAGITALTGQNITNGVISTSVLPVLPNDKLPSPISIAGSITATNFYGSFFGNINGNSITADSALALTGQPSINVGIVTATALNSPFATVGVATILTIFRVGVGGTAVAAVESGRIGVGTALPTVELQIFKNGLSANPTIEVVNPSGESRISLGNSVGLGNSTGYLRYGATRGTLEIINRGTGSLISVLHAGQPGIGTGSFQWLYGQDNSAAAVLTAGPALSDRRLGIGLTNPSFNLHVVGTGTITSDLTVAGNFIAAGTLTFGSGSSRFTLGGGGNPPAIPTNINVTTGISTLNRLYLTNDAILGIGTTLPAAGLGLDGKTISAHFANVGIGTTTSAAAAFVSGGTALFRDRVSIGATISLDTIPGPDNSFVDATGLSVFGRDIVAVNADVILVGNSANPKVNGFIGVGTNVPFGAVDLRCANYSATRRAVFYAPQLTRAEREALVYDVDLGSGGFIQERSSRRPEYFHQNSLWQPAGYIVWPNVVLGVEYDSNSTHDRTAGSPQQGYITGNYVSLGATSNVFIGTRVGSGLSASARYNTFLGDRSGFDIAGDNNLCLGYKAGRASAQGHLNVSHNVVIGVGTNTAGSNGDVFAGRPGTTAAGLSTSVANGFFAPPFPGNKVLAIGVNASNTCEYWLVGNSQFNLGVGTTTLTNAKLTVSGAIYQSTGVSTFASGSHHQNIRVGTTAVNEIDTASGNLILDSAGGTLDVQDNITSTGTISDSIGNVRSYPQNAQSSLTGYVLASSDAGKHISFSTSAGIATVPSGVFSIGDEVLIYNNTALSQTLSQGAGVTMYLSGTATTGNRTLAQRTVARLLCVGTNTFVVQGSGVT